MRVRSIFQKKAWPAHLALGKRGEKIILRCLKNLGLEILAINFTVQGKGEIDIIVRDGFCLCFIEVKTRHQNKLSRPADAVSHGKQQRLIKASYAYIKETRLPKSIPQRFDVAEVIFDKKHRLSKIVYIADYFKRGKD